MNVATGRQANQKDNDQILQCVADQASDIEAGSLAPTLLIAAGVTSIAAGTASMFVLDDLHPS
jgi:hypothetical protein